VGQVRAQLQAGTDVNARDGSQRTALLNAVRAGQLPVIRVLIEVRPDLDARDQDGRTALMEAARQKEAMAALYLVAAGADVNVADKDGWTALMLAAREGTLAAARAIIRSPKQSSLDRLVKETSALTLAVDRGRHELVRLLIRGGEPASASPRSVGGALQLAAEEGHVEIVRR
jgi:ankyrin repeat protein